MILNPYYLTFYSPEFATITEWANRFYKTTLEIQDGFTLLHDPALLITEGNLAASQSDINAYFNVGANVSRIPYNISALRTASTVVSGRYAVGGNILTDREQAFFEARDLRLPNWEGELYASHYLVNAYRPFGSNTYMDYVTPAGSTTLPNTATFAGSIKTRTNNVVERTTSAIVETPPTHDMNTLFLADLAWHQSFASALTLTPFAVVTADIENELIGRIGVGEPIVITPPLPVANAIGPFIIGVIGQWFPAVQVENAEQYCYIFSSYLELRRTVFSNVATYTTQTFEGEFLVVRAVDGYTETSYSFFNDGTERLVYQPLFEEEGTVIPPVYIPEVTTTFPDASYILDDGQIQPSAPKLYGAFIFDTELEKWGKVLSTHYTLVDLRPANGNEQLLDFTNFGMDAGASLVDNSISVFTMTPSVSKLSYGKIGYYRKGYTQAQEVKMCFRDLPDCTVTLEVSMDGRSKDVGYAVEHTCSMKEETLYSSTNGRWFTITLNGIFDLTYLEFRGVVRGRR